jgi:hypothetical protein
VGSRIAETSEPDIALVGDDTYAVLSPKETLGFVYRAGNVYVALAGPNLGHATEVGQSLSWDEAIAIIERSHRAQNRLQLAD